MIFRSEKERFSGHQWPLLLGLRLPVSSDREGTALHTGRNLHTRFWLAVLPCGWLEWMVFGDREDTTQQAGRSPHTRFWPAVLPCGWLAWIVFGDREGTALHAGRSLHTRFWPAVLPCGWLTGQMLCRWRSEPSRLA